MFMKKKMDASTEKANQAAFSKRALLLIVSYLFSHSSFRRRPESRTSETRHRFSLGRRLCAKHDNNFTKPLMTSFQRGSILIGIIIAMVVTAVLGTGMLYLTTTSTYNELIYGSHSDAYYVAEAGGRYAMSVIRDAYATSTINLKANLEKIYYMSNNTSFKIEEVTFDGGNPEKITFYSIGTIGSGLMQAKRKIIYEIIPANQSKGGGVKEITIAEMDSTNSRGSFITTPVGQIKVTGTVDDGNQQRLAVAYGKSSVNFLNERTAQGGFLSYDAQVKVKSDADYYVAGLGFRLHNVSDLPRGFHISFMRFNNFNIYDGVPSGDFPTDDAPRTGYEELKLIGMEPKAYYIILWMDDLDSNKTPAGGSRAGWETLLAYKKLETVLFEDEMETGTNGWTVSSSHDNDWLLTDYTLTPTNYHSSVHSWYANFTGNNKTASLLSKEINGEGVSSAKLSFWYKFSTSNSNSDGQVFICKGANSTSCTELSFGPIKDDSWHQTTITVTNLPSTTRIKFVARTLSSWGAKQVDWYIDDVKLYTSSLTPWSTLLVNLEEKNLTPANDNTRRNVIKVYYSTPTDNPLGAINWPPATGMNLVQWDWVKSSDTNVVAEESNTVVQTRYYRTGTPPTPNPTGWYNVTENSKEIGLYACGTKNAIENHVFFDDFALRIGGGGGSDGSGRVIQY
ncbi:MAG: hypothetical protein PHN98_04550 [Smithellaceae bacterium]|nr:hypothetical protein [Smithellaceae bacterium]